MISHVSYPSPGRTKKIWLDIIEFKHHKVLCSTISQCFAAYTILYSAFLSFFSSDLCSFSDSWYKKQQLTVCFTKSRKKLPDLASDLRSFPASWCKKQLTVCFTKSRKKLPDLASDLRSFPYSWRKKQQWTVCFTKSKKGCQTLGLAAAFDAAVLEAGCPGADITA